MTVAIASTGASGNKVVTAVSVARPIAVFDLFRNTLG